MVTSTPIRVVDEGGLAQFRTTLEPVPLLASVGQNRVTHFQLATGVGKSQALDNLLCAPETYQVFDLVVYLTTANAILDERSILRGTAHAPVPWTRLLPRPKARCGPLDPEWSALERSGCSTFAKATLCRTCPHIKGPSACTWPGRLTGIKNTRLVFATEQQLVVNRNLLLILKTLTKAERVLVILDEARVVDTAFTVTVTPDQLRTFAGAIRGAVPHAPRMKSLAMTWLRSLETLAAAGETSIRDPGWRFPAGLHRFAFWIQREGLRKAGSKFQFLGYLLSHFVYSRSDERRKLADGTLQFTARPYFGHQLLVAAAHMNAEYVMHRLGLSEPAASPFADIRFRHSGTVVYNLKSRIGAERYFKKNLPQVLDFFAVLIRRNVLAGRSTVLLSRKKFKDDCSTYLAKRLLGWGLKVSFPRGLSAKPVRPDPKEIPIVHYGTLGVNTYEDYESLYALNSYYVSDRTVSDLLQEHDPADFRAELRIATDQHRRRHVTVVEPSRSHRGIEQLAEAYLHRLEIDPVLQAAGRVRFYTRPREVILFQMADLEPDIGSLVEFGSLEAGRTALGLPRASSIDRQLVVERLLSLQRAGLSLRGAAAELSIDKQTARRWMRAAWLNEPTSTLTLHRVFEPPKSAADEEDQ